MLSGCGVLSGAVYFFGTAAIALWFGALLNFFFLFAAYQGPKSRLIFSSMWLLKENSLGPDVEPHRRRLTMFAGLFFLAVIGAVAASVGAAGASCA